MPPVVKPPSVAGGGGGGGHGHGGGGGGAPYGLAGRNLLDLGPAAEDGTLTTGGEGGVYGNTTQHGGKGGDLGQDGADGVSSYGFTVGGTAGDAIHGQSFIVWENIGTIYGATS